MEELDCSDISDSLAEMKIRVAYKHLRYPYLYDGATQAVTRAYGPQATPHVFVFDRELRLRYEGRVDNSYRPELVKTQDARDAIDPLLAHRPVAVAHNGVFGCSTKWKEKEADRIRGLQKIESQPVTVESVSADDLKKLRANPTGKLLLVRFWGTGCGSCMEQFADLETTYRMYAGRDLAYVTVSTDPPGEKASVLRVLEREHATSRNLLFASEDSEALRKAFDPEWDSPAPYTVLIAPDGKLLYREQKKVDVLQLRRTVLASLPADYIGFNRYWTTQ